MAILTLLWQLLALFVCCSGVGLFLGFLLPAEFPLLHKVFFALMGGLFLVVLIPQNLVYLGVPVRISAWPLLGAPLAQVWFHRHILAGWPRIFYANADLRTLGLVILVTITFHSFVPIQQGLKWYCGKGYSDYSNYVQLAEFLKEEPYSTGWPEIGLRPWLIRPAIELKTWRIGQSVITAEISTWSGTDAQGGYAATIIFFLTVLAISLYLFLRGVGVDRSMAASGALLAVLLPAVTRLSLDGFLSQVSTLSIFSFFAVLLRVQNLNARSFTLFFSLALAYVLSTYSEIAPLGFGTLFLGVMFVRDDKFSLKVLMLLSAIPLVAVMNPWYLRNLVEFLRLQYYWAVHGIGLERMAPNLVTLRSWAELIFGAVAGSSFASFFEDCAILLGLLFLVGILYHSQRDRLILGTVLLPVLLVILYLSTRGPHSYYPISKIMLSVLPFVMVLAIFGLFKIAAGYRNASAKVLTKLFFAFIVGAAAAGSVQYYSEVLNNEGFLRFVREPGFLKICRQLEEIKNKQVFLFENDELLTPWLCYHARHNDVYVDAQFTKDAEFLRLAPFSQVPDFKTIDFVVTPNRILNLKDPNVIWSR